VGNSELSLRGWGFDQGQASFFLRCWVALGWLPWVALGRSGSLNAGRAGPGNGKGREREGKKGREGKERKKVYLGRRK